MLLSHPFAARVFLFILCLASLLVFGGAGVVPAYASDDASAEPVAEQPLDEASLAASLGMSVLELQTLNLINLDRLSRGVHPLIWDPKLAEVARAHATEMMTTGRIDHQSVDGRMPYQRIKAGADRVMWAGENIWSYRGRVAHNGPPTMHAAMMDEPHEPGLWNHIWNILYPGYRRVGIGIVVSPTGVQYLAENFAD